MTTRELYRAICREETDLPLFLYDWWMDAVCEQWDVAVTMKGQQVSGVWPYPIQQRLFIPMIRTPKLTPYLGPHVFFPDDIRESNRDRFEHDTINDLLNQLPDPDVWALAMQPGLKQVGLFRFFDLRAEVRQTFLIDLSQQEGELFSNMSESLRRNIRAAEEEITVTAEPDALRLLHNYQKITLEDKGRLQHHSFEDLKRLFDACIRHDSGVLWVAKSGNGQIQGLILHVWDRERGYYLMGARNPSGESYRAMSALLWHAARESKKRGHKIFDLEGSMDPGVERFFRNFGGRRELYMILHKNRSLMWKILRGM